MQTFDEGRLHHVSQLNAQAFAASLRRSRSSFQRLRERFLSGRYALPGSDEDDGEEEEEHGGDSDGDGGYDAVFTPGGRRDGCPLQ